MKTKDKYFVGQKVLVDRPFVYHEKGQAFYVYTVTKVGRKWIYCEGYVRFDRDTRRTDRGVIVYTSIAEWCADRAETSVRDALREVGRTWQRGSDKLRHEQRLAILKICGVDVPPVMPPCAPPGWEEPVE
jgi:hypothetical protein